MIRLSVSGCCGRMGSRIISLAVQSKQFGIAGALEASGHPCLGRDVGECLGMGRLEVPVTDDPSQALRRSQVHIEFSTPAATLAHLAAARRLRVPMVIGTTGLTAAQTRRIALAARRIPIVAAPNMSVGVNALFRLGEEAMRALGSSYEVEILEAHHHGKQDAPSGTAKHLAELLARARGTSLHRAAVYGRRGQQPRRSPNEIGIHAIRAGDIVGDHTVIFATDGERLEITHRASSRDTFARGALRAAVFAARKRPGLYSMRDVLSAT
ncbi:MAG: 4-hydroxy-tetrahydrodipicolinate reductase [Candidatus Omnitrophica bacterium]|nr:4-hydroxy-tetrahydrodipicolinate reductase [Candidatus Omnitrophota bacterium]